MHSIYLIENGQKAGPFTVWQLRDKVRGGDVTRETLAWQPGMAAWAPMGEIGSVRFEFERAEESAADAAETETKTKVKAKTAAKRSVDSPVVEPTDVADESGVVVNPRDAKGMDLPVPKPWRRFWARMVDMGFMNLSAIVIGAASGVMTPAEAYRPTLGFVLILPIAWLFLESSCLMILGTTPGKFLLGVRLQALDGTRKLSLRQALGRSFMVWWRGYGLGITIPMLLTCTFSHFVLKTTRTTPWDAAYGTIVSYDAIKPWRIVVLTLILVSLLQLLYTFAGLPPKMF